MFSYFSPEQRVPAKHPLRSIKAYTDSALKQIRPVLDGLYSEIGRPSIPPERLLKAQLLIALYSVRSDRLFCEHSTTTFCSAGSWTWALRSLLSMLPRSARTVSDWPVKT
jgi:hypothetical protein